MVKTLRKSLEFLNEVRDFYFENDRFDAATEAYAKAREYAPEDASVHFVLADATFANGDYHYAAFLISEAVRLDPTIVTAKVDKRTFYSDPKLFETQLEALQAYCKAKPYDAWAQLVLGYNLRFSDRPTRSIAAFRRVMQLDADNPPANAFLRDLLPPTKPDGKPSAKISRAFPPVCCVSQESLPHQHRQHQQQQQQQRH